MEEEYDEYEEYDETYEEIKGDYSDYVYDTYRDDLLTMDYNELVQKYGKRLADAKLESKGE